jgi:hypothetical protein
MLAHLRNQQRRRFIAFTQVSQLGTAVNFVVWALINRKDCETREPNITDLDDPIEKFDGPLWEKSK